MLIKVIKFTIKLQIFDFHFPYIPFYNFQNSVSEKMWCCLTFVCVYTYSVLIYNVTAVTSLVTISIDLVPMSCHTLLTSVQRVTFRHQVTSALTILRGDVYQFLRRHWSKAPNADHFCYIRTRTNTFLLTLEILEDLTAICHLQDMDVNSLCFNWFKQYLFKWITCIINITSNKLNRI